MIPVSEAKRAETCWTNYPQARLQGVPLRSIRWGRWPAINNTALCANQKTIEGVLKSVEIPWSTEGWRCLSLWNEHSWTSSALWDKIPIQSVVKSLCLPPLISWSFNQEQKYLMATSHASPMPFEWIKLFCRRTRSKHPFNPGHGADASRGQKKVPGTYHPRTQDLLLHWRQYCPKKLAWTEKGPWTMAKFRVDYFQLSARRAP